MTFKVARSLADNAPWLVRPVEAAQLDAADRLAIISRGEPCVGLLRNDDAVGSSKALQARRQVRPGAYHCLLVGLAAGKEVTDDDAIGREPDADLDRLP